MSEQTPLDPRLQQPGATDESLLSAHEKELAVKPDDGGNYRMLTLVLLFVFSGLIFYAGTYLNHYAGEYKGTVFNENAEPTSATAASSPAPARRWDRRARPGASSASPCGSATASGTTCAPFATPWPASSCWRWTGRSSPGPASATFPAARRGTPDSGERRCRGWSSRAEAWERMVDRPTNGR